MLHILTGFGLSSASGFNAYLPMLVIGMLARWTGLVHLHHPYDALSHPVCLIVLAVLALLDFVADKVPVVDHGLHALGFVIHPVAGAVVSLAANSEAGTVNPVLAAVCGAAASATGHTGRAAFRPVVTATTGGLGNPVVSLIEDAFALVVAVLAVVAPVVAMAVIGLVAFLVVRTGRRFVLWVGRRRGPRRPQPPPLPVRPPPLPPRR